MFLFRKTFGKDVLKTSADGIGHDGLGRPENGGLEAGLHEAGRVEEREIDLFELSNNK